MSTILSPHSLTRCAVLIRCTALASILFANLLTGVSRAAAAAEDPAPADKAAATPPAATKDKAADKDKTTDKDKAADEQPPAEPVVYTLKEKTAAQSCGPVAVGQKLEVRAAGNITTGYSWSVKEIKGEAVKSGGEVKYVPVKAEQKVGAGGTFVIPLEGLKPGKAEVTLIYARPFEKDKAPAESVVLTVEVQAADAKQADAAPAKRDKPLPIMGQADARAKGFIILFDDKVDAKAEVERLEKLHGFKNKYVYSMQGFKGFAAGMPAETIEKLRWEPKIKSIERDGVATTQGGGAGIK